MEHRKKEKAEYTVKAVDRALDILESFDYNAEELGVTELARKLNLHKNNVFRLLATLEVRGYVEQDEKTGNYRLGVKTFEMGNVFAHHLGLRRQAASILEQLVNGCDETAYLALLDGSEVIYILMHETSRTVRIVPRLGQRLPAHCTAAGKACLAFESADRQRLNFKDTPLRKYTGRTITDIETLLEHLGEVAKTGIAIDNEEFETGVRCVAAPVRDYSHKIVASVGLTGPISRFSLERIDRELAPLVKEAATKISHRLGYEVVAAAAR